MPKADGAFTVSMTPQALADQPEGSLLGAIRLDKRFEGDLVATSVGQMLAMRTPVDGSAGYVAMEWVTGTLAGRAGSFGLQHSGSMTRGTPHLDLRVVPDSGTGALAGLAGTMAILHEGGTQRYVLEYTLPDPG
jgi:hypothetical protein